MAMMYRMRAGIPASLEVWVYALCGCSTRCRALCIFFLSEDAFLLRRRTGSGPTPANSGCLAVISILRCNSLEPGGCRVGGLLPAFEGVGLGGRLTGS